MTTTTRAGQSGNGIEEVVEYALGHRIRVYALTILNEGTYTPDPSVASTTSPWSPTT